MRETSRSPTLAEVLSLAIRQNQADLHVSLPGKILTYDPDEQKADIKPLLQRALVAADGTRLDPEVLPILYDVPICFQRGGGISGGFFLSWPLKPDDLVQLIFIERSIDQYLDQTGQDSVPSDFRLHDLSDAVAYPCFYPRRLSLQEASPDNAVFGRDEGMQLHITPGDTAEFQVGGVADVSVAIAETLETFWTASVKAHLDDIFAALTAWVPVALDGGAALKTALATYLASAPPAFDTAIISDKVKLKDNG